MSGCAGSDSKAGDARWDLKFLICFIGMHLDSHKGMQDRLMVQGLGLEPVYKKGPPAPDTGRGFEMQPTMW